MAPRSPSIGSDSRDLTLEAAAARWASAPTAARRSIVAETAARLGRSEATVYRQFAALRGSERRHVDRGAAGITPAELEVVAGLVARARNKRGQANLPMVQAVELAQQEGLIDSTLSAGRIVALLRERGLGIEAMRAPQAAIARVSQHPNHVWLVDCSVSVQWYFRDSGGKKLTYRPDAHRLFYEGKAENFRKLQETLHRYMAVDHATGAFYCRYYYSAGENAADVVDFLAQAMSPKRSPSQYPFRGVPRRMVTDQGSAWKSQHVTNLLSDLGVIREAHGVGNAKASGAVEKVHDLWQRSFEGRLLASGGASDLPSLNAAAEAWCAHLNATAEHSRTRATRSALWATITPQQLVEAPPLETFLQLASTREREATLDNRLQLRADGRRWELSGGQIYPGCKVRFRLLPLVEQGPGLRAWDATGAELACTALTTDQFGFQEQGRRHVWDSEIPEERGSTAPLPAGQRLEPQPHAELADLFDRTAESLARHAFLVRPGSQWQAPASAAPRLSEPPLSDLDARELVAERAGRLLTAEEWDWWAPRLADGLTAAELDQHWMAWTAAPARASRAAR